MRIGVFNQWGARNSPPVWQAFSAGAARLGHSVVDHAMDADIAVIWSLVWAGRMKPNRDVWNHYRSSGRPVIVLEVGSLRRGHTWKMGMNGLGSQANWGTELDLRRPSRLGISVTPWRRPGRDIVIVLQRRDSEQWSHMPDIQTWLSRTVDQLRDHSDRAIRVRQHPRQSMRVPLGCQIEQPKKLANTYDDFDLGASLAQAWAVINVNSGAGVNAVLQGVPLFCDASSLAAPVGNLDWTQIENPQRPDRDSWLVDLCHTEWTTAEIATGLPLARLLRAQTI
jgi:hypothetical protein